MAVETAPGTNFSAWSSSETARGSSSSESFHSISTVSQNRSNEKGSSVPAATFARPRRSTPVEPALNWRQIVNRDQRWSRTR